MAATETRLPDVVPATDLGKEKPLTPGSSSNQREVVDVVLDESIDVNPAAVPALKRQSSSPPSPSLLSSHNNPPVVQIWSQLDSATELNDLEDQAHHPLLSQHQRHQRRDRHHSSSQLSDPGGYYCFSDSGIDSQIASPIAFGSSTGAEESAIQKVPDGQGRPVAASDDNENAQTFLNAAAALHLTVPSKNRAASTPPTGTPQQPASPSHRLEKHPPHQKLIRQSQLTWPGAFSSTDSTEEGGEQATSDGSAEIDDGPGQEYDSTIASGGVHPAPEAPPTRSAPLLPKTRNHGNYTAIDHGLEVWRSRDDDGASVTVTDDQHRIVGASAWPTIRIQQSADGNQPRTRFSLEESNQPPATAAAGRSVNRLSLDERRVLAEAHVHHPQQVPLDSDPSSSCTLTHTDTPPSSAIFLVPELHDKVGSWKMGSSSSELTDENDAGDLSSGPVSRRPSFGSIRSECGTEAAGGPSSCSAFGASDHHRHHASSSAKQLSRLLSSSSSKSLFLSVPSRVYNAMWPPFNGAARSQPGSPSRPHHSYLDSMTSIASRHSLTKSLSSAGGSPYMRLSSSPNVGHQRPITTLDHHGVMDSSHYIDMVNDPFGICDYATYDEEHGGPPASAVLSLTQRLAFPELVADEHSHRMAKNRYGHNAHIETESNLNFFAKIITFLVLVFVVVLVAGVLVKLYHTPR